MENISRMFDKSNCQRLVQIENSRMILTLTSNFKCDILRILLNIYIYTHTKRGLDKVQQYRQTLVPTLLNIFLLDANFDKFIIK